MVKTWVFSTTMVLVIFTTAAYQEERTALDSLLPIYRLVKSLFSNVQHRELENSRHLKSVEHIGKLQKVPRSFPFPCDSRTVKFRSDKVPESVHKIRPGDIDVVGGMGDSLSAGFGAIALNYFELTYESRGRSFSIGGEENWRKYLTLPNILKTFNPNIVGYSLNSISTDRKSRFNVAEGGAVSKNMPYMAKVLIKRIKSDKEVDLQRDWKMITLMIGDNDFCSEVCYAKNLNLLLQRHKQDVVEVLRMLRDNLPRTIVNVLPPPHLKVLRELPNKPQPCYLSHLFLCPCLFGSRVASKLEAYYDLMTKWQQIEIEVANMKEFDRDDFTVIPHTFTLNYTYPRTPEGPPDYTYLAYDCFHFSQKGHARFANDLWNSLMTPFGKKAVNGHTEFKNIICPSKSHPYIYTRRNSGRVRWS